MKIFIIFRYVTSCFWPMRSRLANWIVYFLVVNKNTTRSHCFHYNYCCMWSTVPICISEQFARRKFVCGVQLVPPEWILLNSARIINEPFLKQRLIHKLQTYQPYLLFISFFFTFSQDSFPSSCFRVLAGKFAYRLCVRIHFYCVFRKDKTHP